MNKWATVVICASRVEESGWTDCSLYHTYKHKYACIWNGIKMKVCSIGSNEELVDHVDKILFYFNFVIYVDGMWWKYVSFEWCVDDEYTQINCYLLTEIFCNDADMFIGTWLWMFFFCFVVVCFSIINVINITDNLLTTQVKIW